VKPVPAAQSHSVSDVKRRGATAAFGVEVPRGSKLLPY
jgi:hypothetical protein